MSQTSNEEALFVILDSDKHAWRGRGKQTGCAQGEMLR